MSAISLVLVTMLAALAAPNDGCLKVPVLDPPIPPLRPVTTTKPTVKPPITTKKPPTTTKKPTVKPTATTKKPPTTTTRKPPFTTTKTTITTTKRPTLNPTCSGCVRMDISKKPANIANVQYFVYSIGPAGCLNARKQYPSRCYFRYITDKGLLIIKESHLPASYPKCSNGRWELTHKGETYTVREHACYSDDCLGCSDPVVAPGSGVEFQIKYNGPNWCKQTLFSGCSNGYGYTNGVGVLDRIPTNPATCFEYFGPRWYSFLVENDAPVSCWP